MIFRYHGNVIADMFKNFINNFALFISNIEPSHVVDLLMFKDTNITGPSPSSEF